MKLLNGWVEGDTRVVTIYRDERGVLMRKNAPAEYSVFLRKADMTPEHQRQLRGSRAIAGMSDAGDYLRVRLTDAGARYGVVKWLAEEAKLDSFEGDVAPVRRHLSDTGHEIAKPRRAYLDIETDSRVSFAEKEKARILSWAVTDDDVNAQSSMIEEDTDDAERDLLLSFWAAVDPYDQLAAWNGDGFDFPMLEARSKLRRCPPKQIRRWLWLDHLVLFKRLNMHAAKSADEKRSMKLESIAQSVLGEGKDSLDGSKTWQHWEAGGESRAKLLRYNERDTDLLRKIEAATGYIDLFQSICEVTRTFPTTSGLRPTERLDGFMLRLGVEKGIRFPTRKRIDKDEENDPYAGAYVMKPDAGAGIVRDVHVADFAGFYPSIILSWNMSPETKRPIPINGAIPPGHARAPTTGVGFSTGSLGIIGYALSEMIRLRKQWNDKKAALPPGSPEWHEADRMASSYKTETNAFYGVLGTIYSRFHDREIAESVTKTAEWLIKMTIEEAKKRGWLTIYSDTDSVYVTGCSREEFSDFVQWCNAVLYPEALRRYGCVNNHVKLAYEKQFDRIVFTAAKKYTGRYSHFKGALPTAESEPEVKGLEWKRGDAIRLACQLQEIVINGLMGGGIGCPRSDDCAETPDQFEPVLEDWRERILSADFTVDDVKLSKSLSRPIKQYAVRTKKDGTAGAQLPHIGVAKVLESRGRAVSVGTRIEYVVTDGAANPMQVIPAEDYAGQFDRYYLWNDLVYPPTMRLLAAAFPQVDWGQWEAKRPVVPTKKALRAAQEGQGGLFEQGSRPVVPKSPAGPVCVALEADKHGEEHLRRVREAVDRHPGPHQLSLAICVDGAEVSLESKKGVDGSAELRREIAEALKPPAA